MQLVIQSASQPAILAVSWSISQSVIKSASQSATIFWQSVGQSVYYQFIQSVKHSVSQSVSWAASLLVSDRQSLMSLAAIL